MSNVVAANITLATSDEKFHAIWKSTRALLGAGWRYKASSDTAVKETTGSPEQDRWAVQGFVNLTSTANTGAAASITTVTNNIATVTGLTGLTAAAVGAALTISGAASSGNNGTFRIVTQSGTSCTIFNPSAVASDANNGSITWTEKNGGTAANITTVTNGIATVTGLTGMVAPSASTPGSTGHTLTITGAASGGNNGTFQIRTYVSATSVEIINPSAVASDANNGSIVWTENDPLSQTYPASINTTNGTGAWIVLQGPSTLKIRIGSNVSTGTFRRGEKITQASSGAEGELLGIVTDPGGGGYLVVAPRLSGSAGGAHGWDATASITAVSAPTGSGASVTPTGGVVEYIREIVIWKSNNAQQGHLYYQCIDTTTESTTTSTTGRFSTMAALGTATTTICPGGATGGSPLTNGFPTIGSMCLIGTAGTGTVTTGQNYWSLSSTTNTTGKMQIVAVNAFGYAGVSPDGTWIHAVGSPATASTSYIGMAFLRLDDTEDGDVDPYVWWVPPGASNYARSRTVSGSNNGNGDVFRSNMTMTTNYTPFLGFRRRGYATSAAVSNGDSFQEYQGFGQAYYTSFAMPLQQTTGDPEKVACTFVNTRVREPCIIASILAYQKQRKGSTRWLFHTQGGNGNDTYDTKRYIQLSTGNGTTDVPVVVGPWDTTTTPTNS